MSSRHTRAAIDWGPAGEMYRSSYQLMLRVAFTITGDRAAAEDAVHDAFCAVAPKIAELDDPVPYLRVAVVNRCRSVYRREAAAPRLRPGIDVEVEAHIDAGLTDFADALATLTFPQRSAVVLRYLCDLSDDDIAHSLGCRRATVRSHVKRGLAALRTELEGTPRS